MNSNRDNNRTNSGNFIIDGVDMMNSSNPRDYFLKKDDDTRYFANSEEDSSPRRTYQYYESANDEFEIIRQRMQEQAQFIKNFMNIGGIANDIDIFKIPGDTQTNRDPHDGRLISSSSASSSVFRMLPDGSTERIIRRQLPDGKESITTTKCDPQQVCNTINRILDREGNQVDGDDEPDGAVPNKSIREQVLNTGKSSDSSSARGKHKLEDIEVPIERTGLIRDWNWWKWW